MTLHTESEIFVWNVRTLKNKYDLTLCQSRLHIAFSIFISHNFFWMGLIFEFFCISSKHFERCFDSSEPPYKQTPQSRMAIVKFIHFISQHKAHIDPYTLISQKLVVFFLICGSGIASIKLSHWHPDVNFESPVILPLLLDKEVELFVFSIF